MHRSVQRALIICCALVALVGGIVAWAATKTVDLDGNGTAESSVALNIISTFPAKVENVVTDKAVGTSFSFNWVSAGPGGFVGTVGPGTAAGVGSKWSWQTSKAVFSFTGNTCANDICFTATAGLPAGTSRGPFSVPGRSLVASGVTLSNASLTSSLVTFFSPPHTVIEAHARVGGTGSGSLNYSAGLSNLSGGALTVHVDAGPPGCCPSPNQLNCDGTCVDYLTDEDNCGGCGEAFACDTFHGEMCDDGECVTTCSEGQVLCGDACVTTYSDPLNCGSCGHACGENQICNDATCITCCGDTPTACNNQCVNTYSDPENCGGCGISCDSQCEGSGSGYCVEGCCHCQELDFVGSAAAPLNPGSSTIGTNSVVPTLPPPAPICETQESTQTIPAGENASLGCNSAGFLAKEVFSFITVCLDGSAPNPGTGLCMDGSTPSTGPFIQLVPDPSHPVATQPVTLAPVGTGIQELSGDGMMEPGELVALNISLSNSGFSNLRNVTATLTSPPQDITPDDGMNNPASVGIVIGRTWYPELPGAPAPSGDCSAASSLREVRALTPLVLFWPPNYLGDTSRVFNLRVTGMADGAPITQDVPITLGVAGTCNPQDVQGNYDGLRGLDNPMAQLIPEDDNRPLPFPRKKFLAGKNIPLSLAMRCRLLNLDDTKALAPKIVGLYNLTTGQPVALMGINADPPNPHDPFFRYTHSCDGWTYNLRTWNLTPGQYRLTVEIAGRKNYVTGFEVK